MPQRYLKIVSDEDRKFIYAEVGDITFDGHSYILRPSSSYDVYPFDHDQYEAAVGDTGADDTTHSIDYVIIGDIALDASRMRPSSIADLIAAAAGAPTPCGPCHYTSDML